MWDTNVYCLKLLGWGVGVIHYAAIDNQYRWSELERIKAYLVHLSHFTNGESGARRGNLLTWVTEQQQRLDLRPSQSAKIQTLAGQEVRQGRRWTKQRNRPDEECGSLS